MPADALNYHYLSKELNDTLSEGRIDKITMPLKSGVVLFVRAKGKNHKLLVSAEPSCARCHITTQSFDNPLTAPSFLMHLRKYISGGKIEKIHSYLGERVIRIEISCKDELGFCENRTLIAEIMGKYSNIILIDKTEKITDCMHKFSPDISSKRVLLPSITYSLPPQQNKVGCFNKEALSAVLQGFEGGKMDIFVQNNVTSLAKVSILEAIYNAFGNNFPSQFSAQNADTLASSIYGLFGKNTINPCVLLCNNSPVDYFYTPYNSQENNYTFFPTLSEAMDYFYSQKSAVGTIGEKQNRLKTVVKNAMTKCNKRLENLVNKSLECSDFDTDKLYGELITANIYAIKTGQKQLECVNYYSENGEIITIKLDQKLSPQKNAQSYYKRYSKKKRTVEMNEIQIEKAKNELEYLDSVLLSITLCESKNELGEIEDELAEYGITKNSSKKPSKQKHKTHNFLSTSCEGYEIIYGKNNTQNDYITKNASPYDLWFHIKDSAGSHVIIKNKTKDFPPDNVILFAAKLAAQNSKARSSSKVAVDYTFIKNISKPSNAFLGKVIYKSHYTLYLSLT